MAGPKEEKMETTGNEKLPIGVDLSEEKIPVFKRLRATICHTCPLCNHARKNPDSKIGKILHHKYHADNCPLWKAEKEIYGQK
jgi:hypothetical protein